MNTLKITRIRDTGSLTMGRGSVIDAAGDPIYNFVTLDPSWILNQSYISCIPIGTYTVEKRYSQKFQNHFHIKDVPQRSYCLIHTLNYFWQTEGCTGVGRRFGHLNKDDQPDIYQSQDTLTKLLELLPEKTTIQIHNHNHMQWFYTTHPPKTDLPDTDVPIAEY